MQAQRKYSNYSCGLCGWTRKVLKINDPGLEYCPGCGKRSSFYVRYTEESVKRGLIKRKKKRKNG